MRHLELVWTLALSLCAACDSDPRPASRYEAAPIRTELGERGLRIEVIADGQGPVAAEGDTLRAHYELRGPRGELVDTSHGKKPLIWVLGDDSAVVEGLNLGLIGARAGELRRLRVPPALGYRGRATGSIPADADLEFLVEVMALSKPK